MIIAMLRRGLQGNPMYCFLEADEAHWLWWGGSGQNLLRVARAGQSSHKENIRNIPIKILLQSGAQFYN